MNAAAQQFGRSFLSQKEVAARLGISNEMLSMLLSGQRLPSITVAAKIEREFGVPCRLWAEPVTKETDADD
jgi:transcriptional regulator with XRE-family HTH domain